MEREKIEEVVKETIGSLMMIDKSRLAFSDDLYDDIGMDSVDSIEVTMALEDDFDIDFTDEECAKIRTINDLVNCIEDKIG